MEIETAFSIDELVDFHPMYKHLQEYGITTDIRMGTIVAIRITRAKVFYDVLDDYMGIIFSNVDSEKVHKTENNK